MTSHETAASIRLTELFIASDTDLDEKYGVKSNTALMLAAKDGRLASLRLLLAAGASRDKRDSRGQLPLTAAALRHQYKCVQILFPGSSSAHITEAMIATCKVGAPVSLTCLLDLGGKDVINARDARGDTPLTTAARYHVRCTALLLQAGADVNGTDASGWTPLAIQARYGTSLRGIQLLLAQPCIDVNPVVDATGHNLRDVRFNAWHTTHRRASYIPSAMTPLLIAAVTRTTAFSEILHHGEVNTLMTTTGDARGRLVEEIARPEWREVILEARRTQVYRSRRGMMAAFRIARFLRDTTCNPVYAAARRSLERLCLA